MLPANKVENTLYSHQGLSYGGILVKSNLTTVGYFELLEKILLFLESIKIKTFQLKELPSIYQKGTNEQLQLAAHMLAAKTLKTDTYYAFETALYMPNRNRKRAINTAIKKGIEIKEEQGLKFFWDMVLIPNLNNKFNVSPVHSISEITKLQEHFSDEIRFFSAYEKTELKAGVVMFITDNVAHFQYSSGREDRSENAALDFLFDAIIKKYSHKKHISFGSSSEKEGKKINKGLAYWKESFGAQIYVQKTYEIQVANHIKIAKTCQ